MKSTEIRVTVDVLLFHQGGRELRLLVVRRRNAPFKGRWALPGGFVEPDEDLEQAARREPREETGVAASRVRLRQLAAYGAPHRDPRGRTVSIAFVGLARTATTPVAADDAVDAAWVDVEDLLGLRPGMAFDHAKILRDGLRRLRQASSGPSATPQTP